MMIYDTPADLIGANAPDDPMFCYRPSRVRLAVEWFKTAFPATPFYAVKANPSEHVLRDMWAAGLRDFDVASLAEVEQVHGLFPDARLAFLHPVKNRTAIARAYHRYGVRIFVLDTTEELDKILAATGAPDDLTLIVRIGVSNAGATLPLTGKFGANETDAVTLLQRARRCCAALGVSFHVGSQAMNPEAWSTAMADLSRIITASGASVDIVDVGGGFPGVYDGAAPPALSSYAASIQTAFDNMAMFQSAELWCEPGRALCAGAESLLVRIELAKPGALYLNDGSYGALYDAVHERWAFPMRALTGDGRSLNGDGGALTAYTLYGPTCDSADKVPVPVTLPAGLTEGDYIEFGNLGAYGRTMATRFNGFGASDVAEVRDDPWPSLYAKTEDQAQSRPDQGSRAIA